MRVSARAAGAIGLISGLVTVGLLAAPWYEFSVPAEIALQPSEPLELTAWQVFAGEDVAVGVLPGAAALILYVATVARSRGAAHIAGALALVVGGLVLYRILDAPEFAGVPDLEVEVQLAPWLTLGASVSLLLACACSSLSLHQERSAP